VILRKPYAFLIKHFKLIHLILTAIYLYLVIRISGILSYYNSFILGTIGKINAINYTTSYYQIAIIFSIILCTIILILMHHKKKPKLLYIILIILYIIVSIITSISIEGLRTIYFSILPSKTMLLYRDLLRIILIFQYISIAIVLVRGLGFDIKKFDFVKDLNEMNIELTDDEEVELTLGSTNNITRKIRRRIREFKYYYIENKVFISIIATIVILIGIVSLTIDKQVINKIYQEQETISTSSMNLRVLNSYTTNKTYNNQLINSTPYSYFLINMEITPKQLKEPLNISNFVLKLGNNYYKVDNRSYERFKDIGSAYKNQLPTKTTSYLLIFNIKNEDLEKKAQLIYIEKIKISLSQINLDKASNTKNLNINDTLNLSETVLKEGYFQITNKEIQKQFAYEYNYDINGQIHKLSKNITSKSNTILKLEINSKINNLSNYDFITNYGKIKYKINNETYIANIKQNKTPNNYKKGLYLEVDKELEQASNIYLEITIRNKKYIYIIK